MKTSTLLYDKANDTQFTIQHLNLKDEVNQLSAGDNPEHRSNFGRLKSDNVNTETFQTLSVYLCEIW